MKAITAIVAVVAMLALAGPSLGAGWIETFEGYGPVGSDLPAPWALCCANQTLPTVQGVGFNSSQGAGAAHTVNWNEARRATGFGVENVIYRTKFMETAVGGRIGGGISNAPVVGGTDWGWETNGGSLFGTGTGAFVNLAWAGVPISTNTVYELEAELTPAGGTLWDGVAQYRTYTGLVPNAWQPLSSALGMDLGAGWAPAYVGINNLGGMASTSYQDDVMIIPEPATMALLGVGGLMVLRRRRAA